MLQIRPATSGDLKKIVSLHEMAFPGFFLTRLGPAFLRELYDGFMNDDTGCLVVAVIDGQICGVLAATIDPDGFFGRLRSRRGFHFALRALPGLLKSPLLVIKKLWTAVRYRGDDVVNRPGGALISSLAVSPAARRRSVGKALVQWYCEYAARQGKGYVYVITDRHDNDAVIRFYKKQDFVVDALIAKANNREMYRLVKGLDRRMTPGHTSPAEEKH